MKRSNIAVILALYVLDGLFAGPLKSQVLLSDSFESAGETWTALSFKGDFAGKYKVTNGDLIVEGGNGYYGVYHPRPLSGHFIIDLEFAEDKNVGLALLQNKEGKPDVNNYSMLCVDKEKDQVVVEVRDRQNGKDNVLDYTGKTNFFPERDEEDIELNIGNDLYKHVLTGKQYSLPFSETNKTIRIFREDNGGFFHYYYQVSKESNGKKFVDWMEVRPSPDWAKPGTEYFVALVSLHEGRTTFKEVQALRKPVADKDDRSTGFKVTQREYNWSGFIGDAFVVSFDKEFPYHDKDIKFVFWTEMNYIPAWHLNNQLLYTYEFVETWDDDVAGCHEPMSDRVRQWTRVEVLEDNPVRKVLKWHYVLCNPNYEVPAQGKGIQLPEVDEYWTFYPDGSGTRHIVYTPKMDSDFRAPHELGELISIAGSKAHSSDFYDSPALTMMNLKGDVNKAHPGPKFDYYSDMDDWNEQILSVHFKEEPDVFCVWSHNPDIPETWSGYPIRYENAWQNPQGRIVHWPVNKRPYTSAFAAGGTWKGEASHACLLSWGVRDGIEWQDHYKTDDNGRKYREWVSLVGLNDKNKSKQIINKSKSWLFKGQIKIKSDKIKFVKKDYKKNAFVFNAKSQVKSFVLEIIPEERNTKVINPVLEIKNFGTVTNVQIMLDNKVLTKNEYRISAVGSNDLLIWLNTEIEFGNQIAVEKI